jgi:predicted nucleic acid-binding protein
MKSEAILDANVLIAAFDQSHADHRRAHDFVNSLAAFYTTPQTQGAFLRFFTRPWTDASGNRQEPRMSTAEAMAQLRLISSLPAHRFLPDSIPFSSVSMRSLSGFKQWNDAYLIALAKKHGVRLGTLERKLNNMDDQQRPILWRID